MDFLRPYPAHLQRGTLLLVCKRDASQRLVTMERTVHIESLLLVLAGMVAQIGGFVVVNAMLLGVGGLLLALGIASWITRLWLLRQRSTLIPSMLFLSKEGIEAIIPFGESVTLRWNDLIVSRIVFARRFAPSLSLLASRRVAERRITGLALRSSDRETLYITEDLDGYDELLDILEEMGIPAMTFASRLFSIRNVRTDWRTRLEQRAHRWRN